MIIIWTISKLGLGRIVLFRVWLNIGYPDFLKQISGRIPVFTTIRSDSSFFSWKPPQKIERQNLNQTYYKWGYIFFYWICVFKIRRIEYDWDIFICILFLVVKEGGKSVFQWAGGSGFQYKRRGESKFRYFF